MYLLKVLVEYQNINLDKKFDYLSNVEIPKFTRVLVEFNNRKIVGFVLEVELVSKVAANVKEIIEIIDQKPIISDDLYALSLFMKEKYLVSHIQVLQTILPSRIKLSNKSSKEAMIVKLEVNNNIKTLDKLTTKQQAALEIIKNSEDLSLSNVKNHVNVSMINKLVEKEYLNKIYLKKDYQLFNYQNNDFNVLNDKQLEIYNKIIESENKTFLLHGITGSGKTEVYLHLARHYLKQDKSVLVLVPEITLTLLMQQSFASHFDNDIAILHSKLSENEKYHEYQKIADNKIKLVVGTRSSIFAPLKNIGLIIIDEEHDSSYKQSSNLMYYTHDLAEYIANYNKANLVLASATPSINSLTKAYVNKYEYLSLNQRYHKQNLPKISIVDLNYEDLNLNISKTTIKKMYQYLNNNKQVIVLINRRGYHTIIKCRDCLKNTMCPNCNVALTYHKVSNSLVCHHCSYHREFSDTCIYCGSTNLKKLGVGIQKIEESLANEFKDYNILRVDQDSYKKMSNLEDKLNDFKNHKYHILVGTQMIAKGLDFNASDLVIILNIDASLAFNSYDALERANQLIVQVAGRAGRHSGNGEVLIETYQPDHYVIQKAKENDYLGFYELEMKERRRYNDPPYYFQALLILSSQDENLLNFESRQLFEYLKDNLNNVIISENVNHPIYKLANSYRQQISIKYKKIDDIKDVIIRIKKTYGGKRKINLIVDLYY